MASEAANAIETPVVTEIDSQPTGLDPIDFLIQEARTNFAAFVSAVHRPTYKHSALSKAVCQAVDAFVEDVIAGYRPILMLTCPPQHGKSSLIARCLPPYLFGRLNGILPQTRIAAASFSDTLAQRNRRDAKGILNEPIYREIFPQCSLIDFKGIDNTSDGLQTPTGWLKAVGIGGSLTGFSVDIGIIDDAVKNAEQALSETIQERNQDWYDSVFSTRLQEVSGQLIIGTPWSINDLIAYVRKVHSNNPHFKLLSFPALNYPDEIGYRPDLPQGALVPRLQSEAKLREMKRHMSEFWWSAMFQQMPMSEHGAIFKKQYTQYYRRADLPQTWKRLIISVDATFKDLKSSDFVCVGIWGLSMDDRAYLLDWRREKLGFVATANAIIDLKNKYPRASRIYIEDAANGPALIDMLSKKVTGIEAVPPLGSKEARAHAVSWVWENGWVMLPHPDERPGIVPVVAEVTTFPDVKNDDAVDMMDIALHQLFLRSPIAAMITQDILDRALHG